MEAGNMERIRNILLCDDNELNRKLVIAMLKGLPYRVIETDNGRDCLAYALASHGEIDLMLLDISMKDMNGIEVCSAIRASGQDRQRRMTVIAYTAHAMVEECRHLLASGFDGILTKPALCKELVAVLDKHIRA